MSCCKAVLHAYNILQGLYMFVYCDQLDVYCEGVVVSVKAHT